MDEQTKVIRSLQLEELVELILAHSEITEFAAEVCACACVCAYMCINASVRVCFRWTKHLIYQTTQV